MEYPDYTKKIERHLKTIYDHCPPGSVDFLRESILDLMHIAYLDGHLDGHIDALKGLNRPEYKEAE